MRPLFIGMLACALVTCKKDDGPATPAAPAAPAGPAAAPNSIASWGFSSSMTNWACLEGTKLTVYCRSSVEQHLRLVLDPFTGPGDYIINNSFSEGNYASFRLNNVFMSPPYNSADSSGVVVVTGFSPTNGLIGTFDLVLWQGPNTSVNLSGGVLDGLRPQCPDADTVFTYIVEPYHSSSQRTVLRNAYNSSWTVTRNDQSLVLRTADTWVVSNPSTQQNTFQLRIPRQLEAGIHGDLHDLEGFGLTYNTPSNGFTIMANSANELVVETHDPLARHIRGTYTVHTTGGQVVRGMFDVLY